MGHRSTFAISLHVMKGKGRGRKYAVESLDINLSIPRVTSKRFIRIKPYDECTRPRGLLLYMPARVDAQNVVT
jgi:hypothetical protein